MPQLHTFMSVHEYSFIAALSVIVPKCENLKEWRIDKLGCIHTMECHTSNGKKWMAATSNNMNEFQNCHVELLRSQTHKNILYVIPYIQI